ncbi:Kelch motif protein [Motilibacter peucedani]|uniref:Kelch motif protein n=1 Tax=Motilibacter peucedani TaxID=598650 RepID=A0A420XQP2_9ACTN|nr:carboxypeptidase regulatory-like domain-containing protein [Motilibacter peucedani]RKS75544.1 Kelch motif protein [Motilibacter peucedani]
MTTTPFARIRRVLVTGAVAALACATLTAPAEAATPRQVPRAPQPHTVPLCDTEVGPGVARCFAEAVAQDGEVRTTATPEGLTPADVRDAYGLPAGGGAGATIAIVDAYDNPGIESDLAVYRATFGLPPLRPGQFRKVDQRGGTDYPPASDAGWAGEIALDVDSVTAVAPEADIILVEADTPGFLDMGEAVNQAVALGAKYVSNSYGSGYSFDPGSGEDPIELTWQEAYYHHPGVVMVASTGDSHYGVSWPAAAPFVTAVGGTSLVRDPSSPRGWKETVWDSHGGGPGSGCSVYEPKPAWQHDSGCAQRTVADVSADADPDTAIAMYNSFDGGGWQQVGGTSMSAPLVTATYAVAGAPVPGTDPASYPYLTPGATLFDVTAGANGFCSPRYLCTADAGYDGPTGLGTPDGTSAFAAGPHGELTGRVLDAATHRPVPGAQLRLTSQEQETSVDADGTGAYDAHLRVGTYTATVSAFGYYAVPLGTVVVADGATVRRDVEMRKAPTATLSGTVRDGSGHGWPLPAAVTVDDVPGGTLHTSPYSGHYSIDLPAGGPYTVHVTPRAPGYAPVTRQVRVAASGTVEDLELPVDALLEDVAGYSRADTGTVETLDTGQLPGWTVDTTGSGTGWVLDNPSGYENLTGGTGGMALVDTSSTPAGSRLESTLTSPPTDFSDASHPLLEFDTWLLLSDGQVATVDLSTDGGSTWQTAWDTTDPGSELLTGHVLVPLDAAAHQSRVRVRFHYDDTVLFGKWWELDDIHLGDRQQVPVAGGLVAGTVTDANDSRPVDGAGAALTDDPTRSTTTSSSDDPAVGKGFYELFVPSAGSRSVTLTRKNYQTAVRPVALRPDAVVPLDVALKAGRVASSATGIGVTEQPGGIGHADVTLSNTGTAPVSVTVTERPGTFTPAATSGVPALRVPAVVSRTSHAAAARTAAGVRKPAPTPAPASPEGWKGIPGPPVPLQDNAVVSGGGYVWSVAGWNGTEDTDALYRYDPASQTWATRAPIPHPREAASAAWLDGKIVVTGGFSPQGYEEGSTDVYDPVTDTWSSGAYLPVPYAAMGTAVLDGKLWLVGGCSRYDCGAQEVQVYDPVSDSWSQPTYYPEYVGWEACGGIDGKLYCSGGTVTQADLTSAYVYDPATKVWTPIADQPTSAWGAFYAAANGQLVVSSGVVGNALTNATWAYDTKTERWSALPNALNALYRGGSAPGFYAIGGAAAPGAPTPAAEVLPGWTSGPVDLSWMQVRRTTFTLAPSASKRVRIRVDTSDPALRGLGTYTAALYVASDDPYSDLVVPVSVTVAPKVKRPHR